MPARDRLTPTPDKDARTALAAVPAATGSDRILALQRAAGNRAVAGLLREVRAPEAAEPLRRRGDSALFPAGPLVTWTLPVSARWIEDFLRFFDFGAAAPGGEEPAGDRCRFNFAPATLREVLDTVDQQAAAAGYSPDRSTAEAIARRLLDAGRAAQGRGGDAVQAIRQGRTEDALRQLAPLEMGALLEALQAVRTAGLIAALAEAAPGVQTARMRAAILTVQGKLTSRWLDALATLPGQEQDEIRHHVYNRSLGGDLGDHAPLRRRADGAIFQGAGLGDAEWLEQFLQFFGLAPPLATTDPAGSRCQFNGVSTELADVVDVVLEQAALAGHLIGRADVRFAAGKFLKAGPPMPRLTGGVKTQIVLSYAFVPVAHKHDVTKGTGKGEKPANQGSAGVTFKFQPENKPHWEITVGGQVMLSRDETGKSTWGVTGGATAAWVDPVIEDLLEISLFGQLALGAATMSRSTEGALHVVPVGQVAGGAQFMFAIPGTRGHLKLGGQAAAQFSGAAGADLPQTIDFTPSVVLSVEF